MKLNKCSHDRNNIKNLQNHELNYLMWKSDSYQIRILALFVMIYLFIHQLQDFLVIKFPQQESS